MQAYPIPVARLRLLLAGGSRPAGSPSHHVTHGPAGEQHRLPPMTWITVPVTVTSGITVMQVIGYMTRLRSAHHTS